MTATADQPIDALKALVEKIRSYQRPDSRSEAFFEESTEFLSRTVYVIQKQLSPDAAEELMEVYECYCDTPFCEFEVNEQECRSEPVEDHLQKLLEEMIHVASEPK